MVSREVVAGRLGGVLFWVGAVEVWMMAAVDAGRCEGQSMYVNRRRLCGGERADQRLGTLRSYSWGDATHSIGIKASRC
jgi:hypothetical protein